MGLLSGKAQRYDSLTEEHIIQNQIRAKTKGCVLFRTNAGDFWQGEVVYSREFKQKVLINIRRVEGLPEGYSDLSGVRVSDGKAVFIEVKTKNGRPTEKQLNFIKKMREYGAVAGVCRSAEEANKLITKGI
jgi:hypothetical protein